MTTVYPTRPGAPRRPTRRMILGGLAAAPATLGGGLTQASFAQADLVGPAPDVLAPRDLCPAGMDTGIVDWTPDVLRPVWYGYREYGADVAPMRLRIYYPSHQPFTEGGPGAPPLLKLCHVRWPLVLLLHGRPPCDQGVTDPDYFLRWARFAIALARSGYVVALPSYEAPNGDDANSPTIARALSVIDWVRGVRIDTAYPGLETARTPVSPLQSRWEHADWVHPRATAVMGHSLGAVLAARLAQARPAISSFVSLSGAFQRHPDPVSLLRTVAAPKLFMWVTLDGEHDHFGENLDELGFWSGIPQPKHAVVFDGAFHFSYVRALSALECDNLPLCGVGVEVIGPVAANLAALFIARHTPVDGSAGIPVSLVPPDVALTPVQQFFARDLLETWDPAVCGTRMTVRWETPEGSGSR